ncbi:MAG TPA: site-2 protease family protein [Nocardioidaceae bacterium]|nr:site-2 protease family protein [Nocardioidaceae bacterium]
MTEVLMYTLGVVLFALGLAASIGLHELGHMIPAKKFGVKVTQYFVGFGRTVWSTRRGETEYGLKAVPLGGYVKLVGMLPPGREDEPGRIRKSNTGMFTQLISDARAAEYELVEPGDEQRLFYRLPWWKKVIVMAGGPMVNLVLAFLLFGAVFMLHGVYEPRTTVDEVSDCVIAATEEDRACTSADPVAPAKQAGLQTGDQIISMNGVEITSWDQFTALIRANDDGDAVIVYERDGERRTTETSTTVSPRVSVDDPDEFVEVGFLGVTPQFELEQKGPVYVVTTMADYTWTTVTAISQMPVKLWEVGKAALGIEERQQDSPMSVVGASRVAGEMASTDEVPVSDRLLGLVTLLGGVNLFVGMFNFIPLLPLDGGHIAGALYEAVRRGFARLFRRPDPGYFDVAKLLPVAYVMAGVILVMSVVLIYADIVALVQLG